jgi:PAS domain-containing protein
MFNDKSGNPTFMLGSFFDITEQKQAENALKTP